MSTPPAIRVTPVDGSLRAALLGLHVLPTQRAWVGAIADLLADVAQCPASEPMAILLDDAPVGYYRIEPTARSVAGHDFDVPALGLRAFFIDARWQGRGLGSRVLMMIFADLARRRPSARLLVLAVSRDNHAARRLYLRAGFTDSGELYHGGHSGPQHLLLRPLP
jgi:GNAT superfamily N-acetyltransferase